MTTLYPSFRSVLSGLGILVAGVSPLSAQTVYTYDTPSADTYVTNANPNTNYGSTGSMAVRSNGNTTYNRLAYIQFDLSSEGLNSGVADAAELTFVLGSMSSGRSDGTIQVYGLSQDYQSGLGQAWGEGDLTGANAPWSSGGSVVPDYLTQLGSFTVPASARAGETFTLSGAGLVDFLNNSLLAHSTGALYVTFILREAGFNEYTYWATKESTNYDPTSLRVTMAVPEPGAMALLLGAGAFGVVLGIRRCKRARKLA